MKRAEIQRIIEGPGVASVAVLQGTVFFASGNTLIAVDQEKTEKYFEMQIESITVQGSNLFVIGRESIVIRSQERSRKARLQLEPGKIKRVITTQKRIFIEQPHQVTVVKTDTFSVIRYAPFGYTVIAISTYSIEKTDVLVLLLEYNGQKVIRSIRIGSTLEEIGQVVTGSSAYLLLSLDARNYITAENNGIAYYNGETKKTARIGVTRIRDMCLHSDMLVVSTISTEIYILNIHTLRIERYIRNVPMPLEVLISVPGFVLGYNTKGDIIKIHPEKGIFTVVKKGQYISHLKKASNNGVHVLHALRSTESNNAILEISRKNLMVPTANCSISGKPLEVFGTESVAILKYKDRTEVVRNGIITQTYPPIHSARIEKTVINLLLTNGLLFCCDGGGSDRGSGEGSDRGSGRGSDRGSDDMDDDKNLKMNLKMNLDSNPHPHLITATTGPRILCVICGALDVALEHEHDGVCFIRAVLGESSVAYNVTGEQEGTWYFCVKSRSKVLLDTEQISEIDMLGNTVILTRARDGSVISVGIDQYSDGSGPKLISSQIRGRNSRKTYLIGDSACLINRYNGKLLIRDAEREESIDIRNTVVSSAQHTPFGLSVRTSNGVLFLKEKKDSGTNHRSVECTTDHRSVENATDHRSVEYIEDEDEACAMLVSSENTVISATESMLYFNRVTWGTIREREVFTTTDTIVAYHQMNEYILVITEIGREFTQTGNITGPAAIKVILVRDTQIIQELQYACNGALHIRSGACGNRTVIGLCSESGSQLFLIERKGDCIKKTGDCTLDHSVCLISFQVPNICTVSAQSKVSQDARVHFEYALDSNGMHLIREEAGCIQLRMQKKTVKIAGRIICFESDANDKSAEKNRSYHIDAETTGKRLLTPCGSSIWILGYNTSRGLGTILFISTSGRQARVLGEASIPEGIDEIVCASLGVSPKRKKTVYALTESGSILEISLTETEPESEHTQDAEGLIVDAKMASILALGGE